jgi:ATP-dependent DNA helicase RecG
VLEDRLPPPRSAPADAPFAAPAAAPGRVAATLEEVGVETIGDLLEALPFRFDDFSAVQPLATLAAGAEATVLVTIEAVSERRTSRRNLRIVSARVSDAMGGEAVLTWFNQRYLLRTLEPGMLLLARGEARMAGRRPEISVRTHEIVASAEEAADGAVGDVLGLAPVYHATARLSSRMLRRLVAEALPAVIHMADPIPPVMRVTRELPLRRDAIAAGHRPQTPDQPPVARRRLAYEELLLLQVALLSYRRQVDNRQRALPLVPGPLVERFLGSLPFVLTGSQQRAIGEIAADLARPTPMQRLLQGDVGSGKTAVALATLLQALEVDGQGALMAPTEVLAVQHLQTAERLLAGVGVEVALLTGDVPRRELDARRQRIATGEPMIAIGTHALLHASFRRLYVAVVDEQHRFGVEQRDALSTAELAPHVLHMTATPIPRSLALTLYGDLDVTLLDELPAGRRRVRTAIVDEGRREACYAWIVEQAAEGRQAYVVCPLVEGSGTVEARAAEDEAARLAAGPFAGIRVGVAHGQQKAGERARVMRAFADGELDVLVATTVIEVGVDVPRATIIVIEDADRFGLSQLHQLRGRVGRSEEQSYCFLFESAEPTDEGRRRLRALVDHASGFELAEIDLDIRGEGHLLGQLQSGRSDLRHARLHRDRELLELARADARDLLAAGGDPVLEAAADERFGAFIAGIRRG